MSKFCQNCGAELKEGQDFCVSCGKVVSGDKQVEVIGKKNNALALTGFIISLASLLINLFGLVGLAGLICSAIGISQVSKKQEGGKGMAIAGLIIGIFSVIYGVIQTINLIALF